MADDKLVKGGDISSLSLLTATPFFGANRVSLFYVPCLSSQLRYENGSNEILSSRSSSLLLLRSQLRVPDFNVSQLSILLERRLIGSSLKVTRLQLSGYRLYRVTRSMFPKAIYEREVGTKGRLFGTRYLLLLNLMLKLLKMLVAALREPKGAPAIQAKVETISSSCVTAAYMSKNQRIGALSSVASFSETV